MPKGPAARVRDAVSHPGTPQLQGAGSPNVFIGGRAAWRGMPAHAVPGLLGARQAADAAIAAAEAVTLASVGTQAYPSNKAAEDLLKSNTAAAMSTTVALAAAGADLHSCATPLPPPAHGPGAVIDGSTTVFINGFAACRMHDTIVEAVGAPNKILSGEPSVWIGG